MRGLSHAAAPPLGNRWLRHLCTQNPFYVISAALVLYGLRQCVAGDADLTGGWLLMGVLCGYTLLLAGAAVIIIRVARVWDDARMILLVLVLLFLALSVSFDKLILSQGLAGGHFLLMGLAFSILVTEGLLYVLRLRLSLAYRLPFYALLALLFGYPLLLAYLSLAGRNAELAWGVYLFPWLAGGLFLTLLPAARLDHRRSANNGTPWRWPLYPWALFVFLWVCVALRTYSLTFAFEAPGGLHATFEPHFLLPLLLSGAVLLLELGIVSGNRWAQRVALSLPLVALAISLVSTTDGVVGLPDSRFLAALVATVAAPVQIAAWLVAAFYIVAAGRQVRQAEWGAVFALGVGCVVSPNTLGLTTLVVPQPWVMELAAVVLLGVGLSRREHWKTYCGSALAAGAMSYRHWEVVSAGLQMHAWYFPLHVSLLCLAPIAVCFDNRVANFLRRSSLLWLPVAAIVAGTTYDYVYPGVDPRFHQLYMVGLSLAGWGIVCRDQSFSRIASAALTTLASGLPPGKQVYLLLQETVLGRGLIWMGVGLLLLGVAVLISLWKGGLLTRWRRQVAELRRQLHSESNAA